MADTQLVDKPVTGKIGSADDVLDILNAPDEDLELESKEVKEPKEPKEEKETREESEDDLELIEPEDEVEKLNLTDDKLDIDAPPRKKEILAKYPTLFKDFPFMEKILYRDRQYTELFGSFDDAKELAEKADIFSQFENQLLAGDTAEVLRNVKDTDGKAFDKIVDGYLPTLYKVDKEAYFEVVDKVNKTLIMKMVEQAKADGNEELQQAALILNQFLYNTSKWTAPKNRSDEKVDDKQNELESERLALVQERFETSRSDIQVKVDNTLRSTINEYIDPRGNMSAYVKKNAVNDALNAVHNILSKDPSARSNLDKLWRGAFDAKFSQDSLRRIQSFYLGKAKQHLKSVILKTRVEAMKDLAPRTRAKEEEQEERPIRRTTMSTGRPASQSKDKSGMMRKGESVAEFLARD